jgi:hypothetical protein
MSASPSETTAIEPIAPLEPIAAVNNAWDLLWVSARTHARVELDREKVMKAAVEASRGSSWNPLEWLLAWDAQICETGKLPAALVKVMEVEA